MLLYFTLLQIAGAGFPEDSEPISISHSNCEYICISYFSFIYIFFSALSSLSLQLVFMHSFASPPCFPLHKSFGSRALSLVPALFLLSTPNLHLHSKYFEGAGCNLAPKDRLSTYTKNGGLKAAFETEPTPHQRIILCFPIGPLMLCDSLNSVVGCADTLIVSSRLSLCSFSLSCRILLSLVPNASQSQKSGNKELANLTHTCQFRRLWSSLRTRPFGGATFYSHTSKTPQSKSLRALNSLHC